MKRKYNTEQRAYMMAKALVDTLNARAEQIEQKYMKERGIVNADGETPRHIWIIDNEEVFNKANEETAPEIDALGIYEAEQLLKSAEDALINYGLSIVPTHVRNMLQRPCFGLDGDYVHVDIRAKVIETAMQLDVSTVPTRKER